MAITKIHPIKSTLNLAIAYITNEGKIDKKILGYLVLLLLLASAAAPKNNDAQLVHSVVVINTMIRILSIFFIGHL